MFRTRKLQKIVSYATIKENEINNGGGPSGIGEWPPIYTRINPPPLGSDGLHCVECLHEMRKLLLNLVLGEPLALVQELASFDKPTQLDLLLVRSIDMFVYNLMSCGLFHAT